RGRDRVDAALRDPVSRRDARAGTAPGGGGRHVQRRVEQLPGGAAAELAVGLDRVGLHWKRAAPVPRCRRGRARGARSRMDAVAAAALLAPLVLAWPPRRLPLIYLALTILAVELSLGLNGTLYRWLYDHT